MTKREVWQRGPIEKVSPILQPVAHALLQSNEDIETYTSGFPDELLWKKPVNMASVGFHLRHIPGVIDRLFTYADGHSLTEEQLEYLKAEANANGNPVALKDLINHAQKQIHAAIHYLESSPEASLTEERFIGRAKIPTTKLGLLFHAAEHSQRHVGQLLVTVNWIKQLHGIT
ncbi:DinB family protein [Negadavirga shengliensis]|uniref:DinB family protein n=1 Tax=Negadavirga shengliensis TaxID=1389218 RepID=A0ABV9T993_9BACT